MTDVKTDLVLRLTDAMLAHVDDHDWHGLTIDAVAERAGVTITEAYAVCPGRAQLLELFARRMDLACVAEAEAPPEDPDARYDQLLDILMMRFEALQPYRQSVAKLLRDVPREPQTVIAILPQSQRSFAFLAGKAGFPHDGLRGRLIAKALSAVWLATQHVWLRDESPELGETMRALDRNLRRALEALEPVLALGGSPSGTAAKD